MHVLELGAETAGRIEHRREAPSTVAREHSPIAEMTIAVTDLRVERQHAQERGQQVAAVRVLQALERRANDR